MGRDAEVLSWACSPCHSTLPGAVWQHTYQYCVQYTVGCGGCGCNGVTCARLLAARCRCSARYQDQRYPPETSARHKRAIRRKPESGIQVRKGCLMSLSVVHETVLHVAQMRPETWEAVGILSGYPRRARPRPSPIAAAGNAEDRPTATGFAERRHDLP